MISNESLIQEMTLLRLEIRNLTNALTAQANRMTESNPPTRTYEVDMPVKRQDAPTNITCPNCNAAMVLRKSYRGPFYGCSKFPACKGTRSVSKPNADFTGLSPDDDHDDFDTACDTTPF